MCRLMKQAKQQKWWTSAWWSVWVCLQKHVSPYSSEFDPYLVSPGPPCFDARLTSTC